MNKSIYDMSIDELKKALADQQMEVSRADRECQYKQQDLISAVIQERTISELLTTRLTIALEQKPPEPP